MKLIINAQFIRHIIKTVIVIIFVCLTGTAAQAFPGIRAFGRSSSILDQWIDADLVPYLIDQLTGHPRFRGQPFMIVGLKDGDVQAEIDGVTSHIREKMVDALLAKPGINLVWQPVADSFQHNRMHMDVSCMPYETIRFYIGIDTHLNPADKQLYVKVRALDVDNNTWISGFSRSFSGVPADAELTAIQRKSPDEFLRGRRPLPFTSGQPDLLASYLARNMACLLSRQQMDDVVMYVYPEKNDGPFLVAVTGLLDTYLSQFSSVRVTYDPDKADIIIRTEIHMIDARLHQIWVTAKQNIKGEILPGVETQTYVTLDTISGRSLDKICATDRKIESQDAGRFLISQDTAGRLTRLLPSECDSGSDIFEDTGQVYAISVKDPLLAVWFNNKVSDLQGLCRQGDAYVRTRSRSRVFDFQRYLDFITEKTDGKLVYSIKNSRL